MPGESNRNPIRTGPVSEIPYRYCACSRCGVVAKCTLGFDFYIRAEDPPDAPLYCYACLIEDANLEDGGAVEVKRKKYLN